MVSDCRVIVRDMAHDNFKPDVIIGPGRGAYLWCNAKLF